jgi:hypothetical protein
MGTEGVLNQAGLVMAAVLLIIGAGFHLLMGIAAEINQAFFEPVDDYAYDLDMATWGWLQIGVGIALALTGFALLSGSVWARILAVLVVIVSATVNFLQIPYYPFWSFAILVVNAFILWAVIAYKPEKTPSS